MSDEFSCLIRKKHFLQQFQYIVMFEFRQFRFDNQRSLLHFPSRTKFCDHEEVAFATSRQIKKKLFSVDVKDKASKC